MFFDDHFFFFLKELCKPLSKVHSCKTIMLSKQLNIHLRIRSQRPITAGISDKNPY